MTDRMAALERVAEAVRLWRDHNSISRLSDLWEALHALDALPAEPVGETVTMALIRGRRDGQLGGTMNPDQEDPRDWEHIGNITFPMPPAVVIPTVAARVEG